MLDVPWLYVKGEFWGPCTLRSAGQLRLDRRVVVRDCSRLRMVDARLDAHPRRAELATCGLCACPWRLADLLLDHGRVDVSLDLARLCNATDKLTSRSWRLAPL